MPVRSLSSSVLRWISREEAVESFFKWAREVCSSREDVVGVGLFGSCARGDWGVGSDLDVVVLLRESSEPFWKRYLEFDTTNLPVPVDLLVLTLDEVEAMKGTRFYREIMEGNTIWVRCSEGNESVKGEL